MWTSPQKAKRTPTTNSSRVLVHIWSMRYVIVLTPFVEGRVLLLLCYIVVK